MSPAGARTVDVRTQKGDARGNVDLPAALFGIEPNRAVLHQVVTAQRGAARRGTHSTKTRAEVAGGGAKPWRQKGTGRSRQGTIRAPHWEGGGIAHGPKPRSYRQRTPKKMVRLALCSALSDRAAEDRVLVVDEWDFPDPKTKDAKAALEALGLREPGERQPRVLLVLHRSEMTAWKSFRNLGRLVQIVMPEELNPFDVLANDWLVFSEATLETTVARLVSPEAASADSTEDRAAPDDTSADEAEGDDAE